MKAKLFNMEYGTDINEAIINKWLENNPGITIQNTVFTTNDGNAVLAIFYTEILNCNICVEAKQKI